MDLNNMYPALCEACMGIISLNDHPNNYDHYLYCIDVKIEARRGYISNPRSSS